MGPAFVFYKEKPNCKKFGFSFVCAGGGNRTPVLCLEGRYSTTKLHPLARSKMEIYLHFVRATREYALHTPAVKINISKIN